MRWGEWEKKFAQLFKQISKIRCYLHIHVCSYHPSGCCFIMTFNKNCSQKHMKSHLNLIPPLSHLIIILWMKVWIHQLIFFLSVFVFIFSLKNSQKKIFGIFRWLHHFFVRSQFLKLLFQGHTFFVDSLLSECFWLLVQWMITKNIRNLTKF